MENSAIIIFNNKLRKLLNEVSELLVEKPQNRMNNMSMEAEKLTTITHLTANWEGEFNSSGKLIWMNPYCVEMTGYTPEEYLAAEDFFSLVIAPEDLANVQEKFSMAFSSNTGLDLEAHALRKDGSQFWAAVSLCPAVNSKGTPIGFRISVKDISQRKKTEIALMESEKKLKELNASKDQFISVMAHDLKSPLSGLMGLTEYMVNDFKSLSIEEIQSDIELINRSAHDIFGLLVELLEWVKAERGLMVFNPRAIRLKETVDKSFLYVHEQVKEKSLKIINDIPAGLFAFADSYMLHTVLRNLIFNSAKFTHIGGTIVVSSRAQEENMLEIIVGDNGVGMSDEKLNDLFRMDRIDQYQGLNGNHSSGMGLLISREFVAQHGGKIWAESFQGKGSFIHFTIPIQRMPADETEPNGNPVAKNNREVTKKLKILIVEDDLTSFSILSKRLQKISNEIIYAANGYQAIECCLKNPDLDLILMDIGMPEMSGNEATRRIRVFNKDVKIIAQSAGYLPNEKEVVSEFGYNDFITKPIDFQHLFGLIEKIYNY